MIDLVIPNRDKVGEVLEGLGFTKQPGFRHWLHDELELYVEIPDDELAGDLCRITEVEIGEYTACVIGIEDLIVDLEYLKERAEECGVVSGLEELRQLEKSNVLFRGTNQEKD